MKTFFITNVHFTNDAIRKQDERNLKIKRNSPCLGRRSSSDHPYTWMTYSDVDAKIQAFGSALCHVVGKDEVLDNYIGIFGPNSPEYFISQYGCCSYGYPFVPIYEVLGAEAMQHILNQTQMQCVVCYSGIEVFKILSQFESNIKHVIYIKYDDKVKEAIAKFKDTVEFYSFEEMLNTGMDHLKKKSNPSPDDLLLICYTSGSTGLPKGVLLNHNQIVDAAISMMESSELKVCCKSSVYLSYLPLGHVMEQTFSATILMCGGRIGFLSKGREGMMDDCAILRPTAMPIVPRLLTMMYSKFQEKISASAVATKLYKYVLKKKLAEHKRGKFDNDGVLDKIIFGKVRKALGGHVCAMVSGGSSILPEVMDFARVVFGVVIEGYGSTECGSIISNTLVGDWRTGTVGAVAYNMEIKLVDVPDLDVFVSRDHRGEICIKGKRCTKGYYKDPEKTAELIDENGWLHTGDVGQWTDVGALKIVDRVKSMFKLAQGEYVAPEKVEIIYAMCKYVNQIFVDGNTMQRYPVAIVVPNFGQLRTDAREIGSDSCATLSDAEMCKHANIKAFVLEHMNVVAAESKLIGFEKVHNIHLTDEEFTIQNGFLTPTLKLARLKLRKHYADLILSLYNTVA